MKHRSEVPSPRQIEIAQLCADGYNLREVSERLGISFNTAKTHAQDLYRCVGASSMPQAVAIGIRGGWLE